MANVIKVKFLRNGEPSGRAYTYYSPAGIEVGDIVAIDKRDYKETLGIVTETGLPESAIAVFGDKAKSILGKATPPECEKCRNYRLFTENKAGICEYGNSGALGDISKGIPVQVTKESGHCPEYAWCSGRYFKERDNDNIIKTK